MSHPSYRFDPEPHERQLAGLIADLEALGPNDRDAVERVVRQYPKDGGGFFSRSEIIRGYRHLRCGSGDDGEADFLGLVRRKPVRTASGVAPVTVLTQPWPCPGRCVFCPSDVRMPKSYLSDEPGAQRAAQHRFDPYAQTLSRLLSLHSIGHPVDKVELIVLGGTWSSYPVSYQVAFTARCFEAMNDFAALRGGAAPAVPVGDGADFDAIAERIDGRDGRRYNQVVSDYLRGRGTVAESEPRSWEDLHRLQRANETTHARCVGLVLETRPDHLTLDEVVRLRRLGATKIQIGYQSLSDDVLRLNHRGHDVAAARRATRLLRGAGFKIHGHWMPNLLGSTPDLDLEDYERLFADPGFRPDELKVYPCSLIESAELMSHHESGAWRPYTHGELLRVLTGCLTRTPEYCRLTRIVRDIPGTDIVAGNRLTNFRELAEAELARRGEASRDIRGREVGRRHVDPATLTFGTTEYATSIGRELFLQQVTRDDRLAGFLRLALPSAAGPIAEIRASALLREVHVYGQLTALGTSRDGQPQHAGLGRRLVEEAARLARHAGYPDLAVISSVGTRVYYRSLGFTDGELYQHLSLR